MKFDKDKQKQIVQVLDRAWSVNLRERSNRIMVADLITKELFGDDDGYLNNTAYGDTPIAVVAKTEVKESVKVPRKSEKETVKPEVQKKIKPKRRTKKNAISRP